MTNLEKFEDEIKIIVYSGDAFAVKKDGNKDPIVSCSDIDTCEDCRFYCDDSCLEAREKWLKEEYIEPNNNIKLPKDIKTGTPIWVKDEYSPHWMISIFYRYCSEGVECFFDGGYNTNYCNTWKYAKPFVEGVNPDED